MKYFIAIALLFVVTNNTIGQITESKATEIAKEYTKGLKLTDYIIYRNPKLLEGKTTITTFDKSKTAMLS